MPASSRTAHEAGGALHRLDGLLGRHSAPNWPTLGEALKGSNALPRWIGWRMRVLVGVVLAACLVIMVCGWWLSQQPRLPVTIRAQPDGHLNLQSVDYPTLRKLEGLSLVGLRVDPPPDWGPAQPISLPADLILLQRSARWMTDADQRERFFRFHEQIDLVRANWRPDGLGAHLRFAKAAEEPVLIAPRTWSGVGLSYWLLSALALAVWVVGAVVLLAAPQARHAAFALLTTSQAVQLMLIAVGGSVDFFAPAAWARWEFFARVACDLITAGALLQLAVTHPRRQPAARWLTCLGWAWVASSSAVAFWGLPAEWLWWGVQAITLVTAMLALMLMRRGLRLTPHPFSLVMWRLTWMGVGAWVLLSVATVLGGRRPDVQMQLGVYGVMIWHVFVALVLILAPYLSRTRQVLQEFSLLAASSTVAASLDLLFVAVFSLGPFASMTLSLFLALGVYMLVRRWLLALMPGREALSMERLFQHLYRIAREVERQPDALPQSMQRLMRELFDPLEVTVARGHVSSAALRGNGAVLLVPLPRHNGEAMVSSKALVLRHSHKGQRLFTLEDVRLADRLVEQLQRALNFDRAVEQGRSEERLRIAQDLHDDIGARLLTLMYQAPNRDIEEYIRHTIQDLKTLTRGLAAQSHTLAEAAAEWKRDLDHRAAAAECQLDFHFCADTPVVLSMVQWSALTRILRELVSNALSHARAKLITVRLSLSGDHLSLSVEDNGVGREPSTWSHGLGLGGVRKRVKQLGGVVRWVEASPRGIRCEVEVEAFSSHVAAGPSAAQVSH